MTVSWLQLERYALGELPEDERARIERALASSEEDRACLDAILSDATVLPPLPTRLQPKPRAKLWWVAAASLAAALALVALPSDVPSQRVVRDGVKGGDAAIVLISERTGAAAERFRDGDRFKLLVTCPAFLATRLSVVMFQDGQRYQPLAPFDACGNQVPWPGAFVLDGAADVEVCVTWHDDGSARSGRDLQPNAVCQRLEHE